MSHVIGIDVGSSATKVGLLTLEGNARVVARHAYPTDEPRPGFKELDPELWWDTTVEGIREISAGASPDEILALCAVGHISSLTFVDKTGRPLRPSVGFQDQRASRELNELYERFSREELASLLGIDLPPSATWPLPKLLWFRKYEPETLRGTRYLLQAKDFVNLRLTGEFASDPSSSRGLADQGTDRVAGSVLEGLGIDSALLPRLCGHAEIVGTVSAEASEATGLRRGLPVVCGWNDLNACVLGSGSVRVGDEFNITGTSEHMGLVTDRRVTNPKVMCGPFLKGKRLLYGATLSGGGSLDWYRRISGRPLAELLALAESAPAGSESLVFLPYLDGERAPIWDLKASGAFVGLRTRHNEGHLVRAILEGVAFSLRHIRDLIKAESGDSTGKVVICGGAAQGRLWNQIKADVLGRRVSVPVNPEAGVLGAAMLAAVAAGCYKTCEDAAGVMARLDHEVAPSPDASARYEPLYQAYLALYPALRDVFQRLYDDRERQAANSNEGKNSV